MSGKGNFRSKSMVVVVLLVGGMVLARLGSMDQLGASYLDDPLAPSGTVTISEREYDRLKSAESAVLRAKNENVALSDKLDQDLMKGQISDQDKEKALQQALPTGRRSHGIRRAELDPQEQDKRADSLSQEPGRDVVLALSSHGKLVLYNVGQDLYTTVDQGNGIYYGMLPGRVDGQVWVSQGRKVGPTPDQLSLFDLRLPSNEAILKSVQVPTLYMHDTVLSHDKSIVYVCDVKGAVWMLSYPDLVPYKHLPLFSEAEHINTLAPSKHGTLWVMLHNGKRPSTIVQVDTASGERVCEIQGVGRQAHGLVFMDNDTSFLILSSKDVALVKVKIPPHCAGGARFKAETSVLWRYPFSSGPPKFLKGLAVIDQVAYFGISDFMSSRQRRGTVDTSLVAFDLNSNKLLWIRDGIGTKGIVNVIGAPYISPDSSYRAQQVSDEAWEGALSAMRAKSSWTKRNRKDLLDDGVSGKTVAFSNAQKSSLSDDDDKDDDGDGDGDGGMNDGGDKQDEKAVEKDQAGGANEESTICSARLFEQLVTYKKAGLAFGVTRSDEEVFYRLGIRFDPEKLREEALLLDSQVGLTYRADVNNWFLLLVTKNGEQEQGREGPFSPVKGTLEKTPYLRSVIDSLGVVVGRSRFMVLKPGEKVKGHKDNVKFVKNRKFITSYWGRRFRIHIPLITHQNVTFGSGKSTINMKAGQAYLFNNGNRHYVENDSPIDRYHLIIDTLGSTRLWELADRGITYLADNTARPSDMEEQQRVIDAQVKVMPDLAHDKTVKLVYESWNDPLPFSPMRADSAQSFVQAAILPRLSKSLRDPMAELVGIFFQGWAADCRETSFDYVKCNNLAKRLLRAVANLECGEMAPETLRNSSLRPTEALEPLIRSMYYECALNEGNPLNRERKPQLGKTSKISEPILPFPGHPFRIATCDGRNVALGDPLWMPRSNSGEQGNGQLEQNQQDQEEEEEEEEEGSAAKKRNETCVASYMKTINAAKQEGWAYGLTRPEDSFYKLPIKFDVEQLQKEAQWLNKSFGFTYRADVNNYFLLLATNEGKLEEGRQGPFDQVPGRLEHTPYIRKVVDTLGIVMGRSRFMMLKAGERVKPHTDDVKFKKSRSKMYSHGYWGRRFRIHVPIFTHEKVFFGSGRSNRLHMEAGYPYLFDNGNRHFVENDSPIDRVHLILDTVGSAQLFQLIEKATVYGTDGQMHESNAPIKFAEWDEEKDKDVQLVYEDWKDPKAFSLMPPDIFQAFLRNNILEKLDHQKDRSVLESLFDDAVQRWTSECTLSALQTCDDILATLVEQVVDNFSCQRDREPLTLRHSSLTVADAVEIISRLTYLECRAKDDEPKQQRSAAKQHIIPLPGHNFRIPPCIRTNVKYRKAET